MATRSYVEWDADRVTLKIQNFDDADGEVTITDIESLTWDITNSDASIDTIDAGAIGIQNTIQRQTGSFTVKITSEQISDIVSAMTNHYKISILVEFGKDANDEYQPYSSMLFDKGRITAARGSNFVVDDTPTVAFDWMSLSLDTEETAGSSSG